MAEEQTITTCSFCGKAKEDVKKLIVGDGSGICNECVDFCVDLLVEDNTKDKQDTLEVIDPVKLKEHLDAHVIGQDQAKMVLSVAVANHYKRINKKTPGKLDKSNVLLLGPTGSGKTLLAKTIAEYLDVPFAIADATSLTEAGYVGDDVEVLISRLIQNADGDIERVERGIIFIDEVDKIGRKGESASLTRDVSGEGVQQALLKMVEGTTVRVPNQGNRKHPSGDMTDVDTKNILFIAAGAFVGLDEILKKRLKGSGMGFGASVDKVDPKTTDILPADIVKYGLIPEFVGRFSSYAFVEELTKADMLHILTNVEDSLLAQFKYLFSCNDVELDFTAEALEHLVQNTIDQKTGARGLRAELERVLLPHMFNVVRYSETDKKKVVIDEKQINNPTAL
jgi:ATP-dependent Clp protease ATP-binding subunit ClpX